MSILGGLYGVWFGYEGGFRKFMYVGFCFLFIGIIEMGLGYG